MRPTRDAALRAGIYLTAAISGLAAAYVLREWFHHLWNTPNDKPVAEPPPSDTDHASVHSLDTVEDPPSLTVSPPPPSDPQASFESIDHISVTTQTTFASLNGEDSVEEEDAQSNASTSDSLVEVMSPHPPRVISKRRSMRSHDLFAESHISFSELGSLVAPQDQPE